MDSSPGAPAEGRPVYNPATGEQTGEVVLGSTADGSRGGDGSGSVRDVAVLLADPASEHHVRLPRAGRTAKMDLAQILTAEHGKTIDDALGEVQRGLEVVEFACNIAHLLKGISRSRFRRASTHTRFASRSGSSQGSPRLTSRRWSRCGCIRLPSPAATPSCSSPREGPFVLSPGGRVAAEAGLPKGCST